jgi:general secretion pathway protein B
MSFILDALKKSEAQRQRGDAPTLYEMKMAPPRQGVPTWLLVLGGLLIINIVVLSVVLLRGNHSAAPQAEANTSGTAAIATPTPAAAMAPAPAAANPPAANAPANPPELSAAPNNAASPGDRADDTPAVEAAPAPAPAAANGGGSGDVPTYDQAASAPGANLPELKLDLHAYATNPGDRFVFLNMVKLKEGQSSPAGVRIESITPDGAILSWQGSRFFLQRQ